MGKQPGLQGVRVMPSPTIVVLSANPENRKTLLELLAPLDVPLAVFDDAVALGAGLEALAGEGGAGLLMIDSDQETPDTFSLLNRLIAEPATAQLPVVWITPALASAQRRLHQDLLYGIDILSKPCPPEQVLAAVRAGLQLDAFRRAAEASRADADWEETRRQGLLGLAVDGRILYANHAAAGLLRLSIRKLTTLYWQALMETPTATLAPRPLPALQAALEQHSAVEVQRCPLWQGDGRRIVCHAAVAPLEQGELRMLFAFRELPDVETGSMEADDPSLDLLTGLPRRLALEQTLTVMLVREEVSPALVLMDIDHLRHVNETLGYELGDKLLQLAAERLRQAMDGVGLLFRVGGDRFAALIDRVRDFREAGRIAQRLNAQFRQPFLLTGHEVYCGLSVGVALWPGSGDTPEALLQSAEIALEKAKSLGRNVVQFYSAELNRHSLEQLERETALHRVLAQADLPVLLEPWLDARGKLLALSAGLDWEPPAGLRATTAAEIAEESGLACAMGRRVIHEVLSRIARPGSMAELPRIMFPLSLNCLRDPRALARIRTLITQQALPPACIQLNLSLPAEDWAWAEPALEDLAARGIRFGLSMARQGPPLEPLSRLPWHDILLEPVLVRQVLQEPRMELVLEALVDFAHRLGLQVMAAGVQGEADARRLYDTGVDACSGMALVGSNDTLALIQQFRDSFKKLKLRY
jgi:diguanylate cyclase (GGDEF)-like protein